MEAARKRHASQHPHSPEPQRRRLLDELEVCPVMNALRLQEADDSIEHEVKPGDFYFLIERNTCRWDTSRHMFNVQPRPI